MTWFFGILDRKEPPAFEVVKKEGEGQKEKFTMKLELFGRKFFGTGASKKLAKQDVSVQALHAIFKIKCGKS